MLNKRGEMRIERALSDLRDRINRKKQARDAFAEEHADPYIVQLTIRETHDLRGKSSAHTTSIYSKQLQRAVIQQLSKDIEALEEKLRVGERDKHLPGTIAFLQGRSKYTHP